MFDENKSLIDEHIEQLLNILWWSQPWRKLKHWSLNKLRNYLNLKTQVLAYKYIYTKQTNRKYYWHIKIYTKQTNRDISFSEQYCLMIFLRKNK